MLTEKLGNEVQDWVLYEKYRNGSLQSFHELFNRYKSRLTNLAYRFVHNRETAEDIVQDVLIKVYEKKAQSSGQAKFSTWAYRVTVNACLDNLRKGKFLGFSLNASRADSDGDSFSELELIGDNKASLASDNLSRLEIKTAVDEAVRNLPENLMIIITLFQFEDKSYQEIAAILGISVKAVERKIYHAKQILREKLSKNLL